MHPEERAEEWFKKATSEKDIFVKYTNLYIAFETIAKSKFDSIDNIKRQNTIKNLFYSQVSIERINSLKLELDKIPLKNMLYENDPSRFVKFETNYDFTNLINFFKISRNNLIHGDKGLYNDRDKLIISYASEFLEPLVRILLEN